MKYYKFNIQTYVRCLISLSSAIWSEWEAEFHGGVSCGNFCKQTKRRNCTNSENFEETLRPPCPGPSEITIGCPPCGQLLKDIKIIFLTFTLSEGTRVQIKMLILISRVLDCLGSWLSLYCYLRWGKIYFISRVSGRRRNARRRLRRCFD